MRSILLTLFLFFGLFAQATYIPTQSTLVVAGVTFADHLTNPNFKILRCLFGSGSPYSSCALGDGTIYTPSGSNRFQIRAIEYNVVIAGALVSFYSDNNLGLNSSTTPTGQVYWAGANATQGSIVLGSAFVAGTVRQFAYNFIIPNAMYIGYQSDGSSSYLITVYGYEIP